jgi:predicted amidohydrolase
LFPFDFFNKRKVGEMQRAGQRVASSAGARLFAVPSGTTHARTLLHTSAMMQRSAAAPAAEGKAPVSVALIQFHSESANPDENQAKAEGFVREAARNGAQFILLPELYR